MTFQQGGSRPAGHAKRASLLAPLDGPPRLPAESPLTDRIGAILGHRQRSLDMPPYVEAMRPSEVLSGHAANPVPPILSGLGWVLGGAGLCGCLLTGLWLALAPGQGSSFDVASAPPAALPAQAEPASPAVSLSPHALSELDTVETASVRKADPPAPAPVAPDAQSLAETRRLKDELASLRLEQAQAQKRIADQSAVAGSITLAGLVSGTFPAELLTPPLDDLRRRYADARLVVDQLTQALGPRHPRLQAAQGQADVLKADLERELRGLAADARLSLQQEQRKARALAARNAELTAALRQAPAAAPPGQTAQADNAALVTASIPAAAARPPADPAPVFQPSAEPAPEEQPLPPEIDTETTLGGLVGILALAAATGAVIVGLGRLGRRKLGLAQELIAPTRTVPPSDAREAADEAMAASATDLAQLRLEVAALRQRVYDFSERRYRRSA